MSCPLATERVWTDKSRYHEAEKNYFEQLSKLLKPDSDNKCAKISTGGHDEICGALPIPSKTGAANLKKKTIVEKDQQQSNAQNTETKEAPVVKHKKEKNKKNKQINTVNASNNKDGEEKIDQEKESVKKPEESLEKSVVEEVPAKAEEVKPKKPKKKKKNNQNKEENSPDSTKRESGKKQEANNAKNCEKNDNNQQMTTTERQKVDKVKVSGSGQCTLVSEIAKARQHIKNSLERMDGIAALAATPGTDVLERLNHLQKENDNLHKVVEQLQKGFAEMQVRMKNLEDNVKKSCPPAAQSAPAAPKAKPEEKKKNEEEDDDGVDLFASDSEEEDAAAAKIREQRLAEYNAKKSKKPALIAKSSVILDVKPWDDETDMAAMEKEIRKISCDGLLWGAARLVPVAFGIKKLSINCVVEDEKVSIDWLSGEIEKLEDCVQSVDVAAFNKI